MPTFEDAKTAITQPSHALQEKSQVDAAPPTPGLAAAKEQMVALAEQAGKVQQQCGLDIVPAEFARGVLKWGLMQVSSDTQSAAVVLPEGGPAEAMCHTLGSLLPG